MAEHICGVHVDELQIDEIWQYVFCKEATAQRKNYVGGCGDSYTFTAIERHTKIAGRMALRPARHERYPLLLPQAESCDHPAGDHHPPQESGPIAELTEGGAMPGPIELVIYLVIGLVFALIVRAVVRMLSK
jgi:hypothetical protein